MADYLKSPFVDYTNRTGIKGHILIAHIDSSFSYEDLKAITRNTENDPVGSAFTELDSALNTTDFEDSIKNVWGAGTDTPIQTKLFNLSSGLITNVPIVNSTITSDFVTGILWDTGDDQGNLRYDALDKEDVVFITEITYEKTGQYGTYDYEIKIPALLRDYIGSSDKLAFYLELN